MNSPKTNINLLYFSLQLRNSFLKKLSSRKLTLSVLNLQSDLYKGDRICFSAKIFILFNFPLLNTPYKEKEIIDMKVTKRIKKILKNLKFLFLKIFFNKKI